MSIKTRTQNWVAPRNEKVGLADNVSRLTAVSVVWITRFLIAVGLLSVASTFWRTPGTSLFWDRIVYRSLQISAAVLAMIKVRHSAGKFRAVWVAFALALTCSASAGLILHAEDHFGWTEPANIPVVDIVNLSFYPCMYVAVAMLMRAQVRAVPKSVWLDGLIGASACTAVALLFEYSDIVSGASGGSVVETTLAIAYPVADVLILAVLAALLPLSAWRPGRVWMFIALGLTVNSVGDFALAHVVDYQPGTPWDIPFDCMFILLGLAPWRRAKVIDSSAFQSASILAMPVIFSLSCVGVLLTGTIRPVAGPAIAFALVGMVGSLIRVAVSFREIRSLAESREQARVDDLTELGNRRYFYEKTNDLLRGRAFSNPLALLVVDLDRFKEINDSLGHTVGDNLLRQLGPRLKKMMPKNASLARLGGDEFAVVLDGADDEEAILFAHDVVAALEEPFVLDGVPVRVSASVGISLFPEHANKTDGLLQRADVAMYTAKKEARGPQIYAADRDNHTRERLRSIHELRRSIDQGRLIVYYQPQVDSHTGKVVASEALVRMMGSDKNIIPPDSFLPLAEQAGLMRNLTEQVVTMVLDQCVRWRDAGLADMKVSINLSVTNLLDVGFPDMVQRELNARQLSATQLVFEVTEGTMLSDLTRAQEAAHRLRAMGAEMSLDDYGTGYASLAYLRKFPLDELKLDRSFVANLENDVVARTFVQSAVEVAHALGLRVVAEGIETQEVWRAVNAVGGDICQGYYFARPMPADDFMVNVVIPEIQRISAQA